MSYTEEVSSFRIDGSFQNACIKRILSRLLPYYSLLKKLNISSFYVGGGAFLKEYQDIDIFPVIDNPFNLIEYHKILCKTKYYHFLNNKTLTINKIGHKPLQLCNYDFDTIFEMVESFDFAHIKIGALITNDTKKKSLDIKEIYINNVAENAAASGKTWYISHGGTGYPISSLKRLFKFYSRGLIPNNELSINIIKILIDILNVKFDSEVFCNQMKSIGFTIKKEVFEEPSIMPDRHDYKDFKELFFQLFNRESNFIEYEKYFDAYRKLKGKRVKLNEPF